jgi:Predicted N-acetylglucosamine kinase
MFGKGSAFRKGCPSQGLCHLGSLPFRVWDRFHLAERFLSPVFGNAKGGAVYIKQAAAFAVARSSCFPSLALSLVSTKRVVVGLDAGGSNTLLLAECEGWSERIKRHEAAANPQRIGVDESARILATLVREAVSPHRPIGQLLVCAGVAGAGHTEEQEALADRLQRALAEDADDIRVEVLHDACIALEAAFGSGSGLVIIAGTGSVVLARSNDGTRRRAGGWGYRLGDVGSGYAVGRAGLRAVAAAFDGGADTVLCTRVDEQCGIDGRKALIRRVYQEKCDLQDVAPLVIEAAADGDSVASDILASQAAALTQQVEWLLDKAEDVAPRIALLGGMLRNEHYARVLRRALRAQVPDWSVEVLDRKPVAGALHRARRLDA